MRRQRSVSFYAETEDEYIEEYNRRKSISERRRCRSRSYAHSNDGNSESQINNDKNFKKKFFQSYDDLELDQLGVNSTFQITTIEKEESEENEGGLIQNINNINLSFKQNNNNLFFSNLAPFTKNIIGPLESISQNIMTPTLNIKRSNKEELLPKMTYDSGKKEKNEKKENNIEEDDDENGYGNLMGGIGSYQMGYLVNNEGEDSNNEKRERINSTIENNCDFDENDGTSFLNNINIDELNNSKNKLYQSNDYYLNNDNNYNNNYNIDYKNYNNSKNELEQESSNNNNDNLSYEINSTVNNFETNKIITEGDNSKNNENNDKNDDKKMRRYTFDINTFFPDNNYRKEGEDNESPTPSQNKTLQNFISKNEFLSKNIDFVDEHLKFLITGSDIKSKHLFLNQLLNEKSNCEDSNYESFNICKKVIKLLGDYIKLELYEEDCSLCYSHMLNTYIDFSDGVILIVNMNIPSSAKYIYDIIEKLKYKISKDKRHFNVILLCFEIITTKDSHFLNLIKKTIVNNNNEINESKNIIDKIINDFELKPNYITFNINEKDDCEKNGKFELVINKFLSLAYLKKERKRKKSPKNNVKKHKRGITGL